MSTPRTAVIYLDGLNSLNQPLSATELAKRLGRAIDQQAATRGVHFELGEDWTFSYGEEQEADVQTLRRMNGEDEEALLDVYRVDYLSPLVARIERQSAIVRMALLLYHTYEHALAYFAAFFRPSTSKRKLGDITIACFWLTLLFVNLLFLVAAIFDMNLLEHVSTQLARLSQHDPSPAQTMLEGEATAGMSVQGVARNAFLFLNLGALAAPRSRLRAALSSMTTGCTAMLTYLGGSDGRPHAIAHIPSLLEQLHKDRVEYDQIHLVGYSFGSLVALDTVFADGVTHPKVLADLSSITTIGCPLETLESLRPGYYRGRTIASSASDKWINVYLERDPLSTRTRLADGSAAPFGVTLDDGKRRAANAGIDGNAWGKKTNVGMIASFFMGGMKTHTAYWEDSIDAPACFDPLVLELFDQTPLMA